MRAGGLAIAAASPVQRRVFPARFAVVGQYAHVFLHALVHLVTDDIHEALKHLLDVDVVLRAGFEELET